MVVLNHQKRCDKEEDSMHTETTTVLDRPEVSHLTGLSPTSSKITRNALLKAWTDFMPELNMRADLTLKLARVTSPKDHPFKTFQKLRIDEDIIATVVRAMNRLNRYLLGPNRKQRRLGAVFFWECGTNGRPHVHGLVERPEEIPVAQFITAMSRAWHGQPFGHRQVRIEPIRSLGASLNYDSKAGFHHLVYFHKHDRLKGTPQNANDNH
jgi:hypothetical protein